MPLFIINGMERIKELSQQLDENEEFEFESFDDMRLVLEYRAAEQFIKRGNWDKKRQIISSVGSVVKRYVYSRDSAELVRVEEVRL